MQFRYLPHSRAALLWLLLAAGWLGCPGEPAPAPPDAALPQPPAPAALAPNGCQADAFVDRTADPEVEILFGDAVGFRYEPNCVTVRPGTRLRFRGEFEIHPLAPGTVEGLEVSMDPSNPIPATRAGREAVAVANDAGAFGWYCDVHIHEGMMGMVRVR